MYPAVYLQPAKQGLVCNGHPWVFPKAIKLTKGRLVTGELVQVFTQNNTLIGVGMFNEHSLYRVRMLATAAEFEQFPDGLAIITNRFKQAKLVRDNLALSNTCSNAFRLFNSEADGLSGFTMDYFDGVLVVASSAYWVERHKTTIKEAIESVFKPKRILWLAQAKPLKQDGWTDIQLENNDCSVVISEEGVAYEINFNNTQKTGLFLDQRENHHYLSKFVKNKSVLDLYTYMGGFALHAAKAGARKVTAVDSSDTAINQAKKNAILNKVEIEFITADARDYLHQAKNYDVVILDPPKLIPSQKHLQQAKNYYRYLHRELFKVMRSGSLLMTCNCSSAISAVEFSKLVQSQALAVNKQVRQIASLGPACCHPTLPMFPEGNYLTAALFVLL